MVSLTLLAAPTSPSPIRTWYVDTNFVPSAGGTFTGQLTVKQAAVKCPGLSFPTATSIPSGSNKPHGSLPWSGVRQQLHGGRRWSDRRRQQAGNDQRVKDIAAEVQAVAASSSTTSTGATRRFRAATTAPISFNTIALLDSDGLATKNFANIAQVLMSWDQMNPEYITKTRPHQGPMRTFQDILRGYLTVLDYKLNNGRNVAFQVMPGKYGGNTSEIGYGKRLSLTFNGDSLAPMTPSGAPHDHQVSPKPWQEGATLLTTPPASATPIQWRLAGLWWTKG